MAHRKQVAAVFGTQIVASCSFAWLLHTVLIGVETAHFSDTIGIQGEIYNTPRFKDTRANDTFHLFTQGHTFSQKRMECSALRAFGQQ